MSRTYRNRLKHTNCTSEERFMKRTWINWRTGIPEPLHDEGTWDRYSRDGLYSRSNSNKGYRDDTNKLIRNKNRVDIQRIKSDPENAEDMTFATKWHGKHIAWTYW